MLQLSRLQRASVIEWNQLLTKYMCSLKPAVLMAVWPWLRGCGMAA